MAPARRQPRTKAKPAAKPAALYTLQVFLTGAPPQADLAGKEISRTIQIRGDQTLHVLHRAIFKAFDREDEHLYEFQFGKRPFDPDGPRYQPAFDGMCDADGDTKDTTIDDLGLKKDRVFGYWFDFGDDWMHQIRVERIEDAPARARFPRIVARVGKSPPQYAE